jgi:succinoglycan biosynthesis transport protein ExoP
MVQSTAPANHSSNASPWNPVAAIFRSWRWALPLGIMLAAIAAATQVVTFVPKYRASCLLAANHDYVVFKDVMPVATDLAKSERALISNPLVLNPVLSDTHVLSAPSLRDPRNAEANLAANLRVSSAGTSATMVISYEDTEPEAAALVCNAIVDSYLRQRDAFDNKRVSNLEGWLEPELQKWEATCAERQRKVESLQKVFPKSQADDMEMLAMLRTKITETKLELAMLEARHEIGSAKLETESNSEGSQAAVSDEVKQSLNEVELQRALSLAKLKILEENYREEKAKFEQSAGASAELQFARDEYQIASEVLSKLRRRIASIRTERRQDGAVRLIAGARTPSAPSEPMPIKRIIWTSVAALFSPFLLGYLIGFRPTHKAEGCGVESPDEAS